MKRNLSIKNVSKILLRITVSVTLMIWLLSKVEIDQIAGRWGEVNWFLLILAVTVLNLICMVLKSIRLMRFLHSLNIEAPIWWLSLLQLKSNFLRNFAPGIVFSDIYRTSVLVKKTGHGYESISTILLEKIFGVASLLLLSIMSLLVGTYWIDHPVFRQLVKPAFLVSGAFLAAGIAFIIIVRVGLMGRNKSTFNFWMKFQEIATQYSMFFSKIGNILEISILSLLIQLIMVAWYFTVSRAIGFNLSFLIFLLTIPLVELLLMLPISIGGLGVREGAFVILFVPFGLTAGDAVSFSLLSFIMVTIIRIFSGAAFLFDFDHRTGMANTAVLKHRSN